MDNSRHFVPDLFGSLDLRKAQLNLSALSRCVSDHNAISPTWHVPDQSYSVSSTDNHKAQPMVENPRDPFSTPSGAELTSTAQQPGNVCQTFLNPTQFSRPAAQARPKIHSCTWEGCNRTFTGSHNVRQHIRERHTGERPYACGECAQAGRHHAFARPGSLYRHERDVHGLQAGPGRGQMNRRGKSRGGNLDQVGLNAPVPDGDFAAINQNGLAAAQGRTDICMGLGKSTDDVDAIREGLIGKPSVQEAIKVTGEALGSNAAFPCDGEKVVPDNHILKPQGNADWEAFTFDEEPLAFFNDQFPDIVGDFDALFSCLQCNYAHNGMANVLAHMHTQHQMPTSRMCTCNACTESVLQSEEETARHAEQLAGGGFRI